MSKLAGGVHSHIAKGVGDVGGSLHGRVMALIDSAISDETQREALKNVAKQTIVDPVLKDLHYMVRFIASIVWEYEHRNEAQSDKQKIPYWHTYSRQNPDFPDPGFKDIIKEIEGIPIKK